MDYSRKCGFPGPETKAKMLRASGANWPTAFHAFFRYRLLCSRGMKRIVLVAMALSCICWSTRTAFPQTPAPSHDADTETETSTDFWVMLGSDFIRPGLGTRMNANIGIGHTFGVLKKDPFGDEVTFTYTYENAGSHGFFHTPFGAHTEALGIMKNFALPKTKLFSGYTMIQGGITSMTGNAYVQNRFYDGEALGAIIHINDRNSIWVQETFNKVVTLPWYTTASIGYTRSW